MNLSSLSQATSLAKRREEIINWLRYASGYSEMQITPLADRANSIRVFSGPIRDVLEQEKLDIEAKLEELGVSVHPKKETSP